MRLQRGQAPEALEPLYTRDFYEQPYDKEFSFGPTYGEHREALELGPGAYRELQAYAREQGIAFFATAWDVESADFLAELDVPAFKLASGDLKNTPLQRYVARFGKPIFLSTGGGTLDDVQRAVETILPLNEQLCVLQCTAAYPAAAEDLNLSVITTLRERFPELGSSATSAEPRSRSGTASSGRWRSSGSRSRRWGRSWWRRATSSSGTS